MMASGRARASARLLLLIGAALCACSSQQPAAKPAAQQDLRASSDDEVVYTARRERMVLEQLERRDIRDAAVLNAMRKVPRHLFVLDAYREHAYEDTPLPIDAAQTISQPYIVALMSQLAAIKPGDRVLEVGTGSGYQAAVLAAMGAEVYSIEIVEELATGARDRLARAGYAANVRYGDGYAGWQERAPFAAILITAAPPAIPEPLAQQLARGGRLVAPVGEGAQDLVVVTRTDGGFEQRSVLPVRFVPMTGRAQRSD